MRGHSLLCRAHDLCSGNGSASRAKRWRARSSKSSDTPSSKGVTGLGSVRSMSSPTTAGTVVFVEVKTKTDSSFSDPVESVTKQKQRRLVSMAEQYAAYHRLDRHALPLRRRDRGRLGRAAEHHGLQGRLQARMVTTEIRRDPITGRIGRDRSARRSSGGTISSSSRCGSRMRRRHVRSARGARPMPAPRFWRGARAGRPTCRAGRCASCRIAIRCCGSKAAWTIRADGLFETRDGLGAHEVIVETPLHDQPLHALEPDRLWRVLWAWRTRLQDLKRDSRFASVVIFKNHGRAAGARLDHAHSQLAAYPILPPAVAEKVQWCDAPSGSDGPLHFLRHDRRRAR